MVNYNNKAWLVAKYGVMLALIFVATVLDRTFTVYLPITGATIEMLMTLSLCFLFNSWLDGLLAGTFMGLSSFATAFFYGKILPQNPLVSVVPRIFVGVLAFSVYRLTLLILKKVNNKIARQTIAIVPACLVGLVSNTVLFLGSGVLFKELYGSLIDVILGLELVSMLPEYLVSLFCVAPLVLGVRKGLKLGIEGNNWKFDDKVNSTPNAERQIVNGDKTECDAGLTDADETAAPSDNERNGKTCDGEKS